MKIGGYEGGQEETIADGKRIQEHLNTLLGTRDSDYCNYTTVLEEEAPTTGNKDSPALPNFIYIRRNTDHGKQKNDNAVAQYLSYYPVMVGGWGEGGSGPNLVPTSISTQGATPLFQPLRLARLGLLSSTSSTGQAVVADSRFDQLERKVYFRKEFPRLPDFVMQFKHIGELICSLPRTLHQQSFPERKMVTYVDMFEPLKEFGALGSRDPVFDPKHFQIVCEAVGLERVQYLFLKLNNCALHSASDVVFDCCAHAHIGGAGDKGETVLINIKMTTHDKMASPSWLNEKFMEQALREGKKDPKLSVKHIDIKMATTPEMAKILEKVELEDYHSLSAEGLFSTNVPERILILQDLAEQGFKLDRSHKGFDLKQSMLVMSFLGRFHAASVILKEQDPTLMNDYMTSYWAESKNVDGPTGHWIFTMMMVLSREIESWPGFSENSNAFNVSCSVIR
uniref:Uncharacterized protein n=1 Tax=Timema cristinae TaxID=61476 RepID=A0A7R9CK49_TIMCR|nr:unnamed protein product [Timema cristinae]